MADQVQVEGFRIVRRLGTGGFGTVYEAVQEDVDAPVALKVLAFDAEDEKVRARFERECRTMGRLRDQPGVVPVYRAAFAADGRPVIVMGLMAGGSLAERLQREGPLPTVDVRRIGIILAEALQAAHELGIHHRDIKPENILIGKSGVPALADFGLATVGDAMMSSMTEASLSPPHAPPERFRGTADQDLVAGDIYSLGSTLYHLLAGHPPYGTASDGGIAALMQRIMHDPVPVIGNSAVDPAIVTVIERSLAKDPASRPASAGEVARLLAGGEDTSETIVRPTALIGPPPVADSAPGGPDQGHTTAIPTVVRSTAIGDAAETMVVAGAVQGSSRRRRRGGWIVAAVAVLFLLAGAGIGLVTFLAGGDDAVSSKSVVTTPTTKAKAPPTTKPTPTPTTKPTPTPTTKPTPAPTTSPTVTPPPPPPPTAAPVRAPTLRASVTESDISVTFDVSVSWNGNVGSCTGCGRTVRTFSGPVSETFTLQACAVNSAGRSCQTFSGTTRP